MRVLILCLALALPTGAGGAVNEEVLIFRNFARSANDAKFRAETAKFLASITLERAQYEVELLRSLQPSRAASWFEYSNAIMDLQRANFAHGTAQGQMIEADANERAWTLHAESLERGQDRPRAIAALNVELRRKQLKVATDFLRFAKPTVRELTEQYERMRRMLGTGAVSREDFRRHEIMALKARDFVPAIERNVARAQARLSEAEAELGQLGGPP